jgi:hypothetical protein
MTAPGHITLLDWEEAGMGPAVQDVGFLLVNCDGKAPWDSLPTGSFHSDEKLLQATIKEYCHYHQLTAVELDYLPGAIRFRSLVFGACSFASATAQQKRAEFSEWWWQRYCAAELMRTRQGSLLSTCCSNNTCAPPDRHHLSYWTTQLCPTIEALGLSIAILRLISGARVIRYTLYEGPSQYRPMLDRGWTPCQQVCDHAVVPGDP